MLATLGSPSVQDLKAAIRMNAIANNPVTTEDVNIAEAIYGVDLGTLKGKTVKTTPKGVRKNHIEILWPPQPARIPPNNTRHRVTSYIFTTDLTDIQPQRPWSDVTIHVKRRKYISS